MKPRKPYAVVHRKEWEAMSPKTRRAFAEMLKCLEKHSDKLRKRHGNKSKRLLRH